jgi:hypothetical protein
MWQAGCSEYAFCERVEVQHSPPAALSPHRECTVGRATREPGSYTAQASYVRVFVTRI